MKFKLVESIDDRLVEEVLAEARSLKKYIYEIRYLLNPKKSRIIEYFCDDFEHFVTDYIGEFDKLLKKHPDISWEIFVLNLEIDKTKIRFPQCDQLRSSAKSSQDIQKLFTSKFSIYKKSHSQNIYQDIALIDTWSEHHVFERPILSKTKLDKMSYRVDK